MPLVATIGFAPAILNAPTARTAHAPATRRWETAVLLPAAGVSPAPPNFPAAAVVVLSVLNSSRNTGCQRSRNWHHSCLSAWYKNRAKRDGEDSAFKSSMHVAPFHMAQSSSADAERDVNDCCGGASSLMPSTLYEWHVVALAARLVLCHG